MTHAFDASVLKMIPIRLNWFGWEGCAHTLRERGWEVNASFDHSFDSDEFKIMIAAVSPVKDFMICGDFKIPRRIFFASGPNRNFDEVYKLLSTVGVAMQMYKATDRIHVHDFNSAKWSAMQSLDSIDGYIWVADREVKDLQIFKKPQGKEIYLSSAAVDDCLNQILKVQYPEQVKLKEGRIDLAPKVQATIYSLAA